MSKTFYAIESQSIGCTVHTFESKKDRDTYVAKRGNWLVQAATYDSVPKRNDRGVYVRTEHHKKEIPAKAGNV